LACVKGLAQYLAHKISPFLISLRIGSYHLMSEHCNQFLWSVTVAVIMLSSFLQNPQTPFPITSRDGFQVLALLYNLIFLYIGDSLSTRLHQWSMGQNNLECLLEQNLLPQVSDLVRLGRAEYM
jgi:hypothetical protein